LNAELREERLRAAAARGPAARPAFQPAGTPPRVLGKAELELETGLVSRPARSPLLRSGQLWFSGAVHGILVVGLILVPLWREQALPVPAARARAFFVEPPRIAPAPPPPAAPRQASARVARSSAPKAEPTFTAPSALPDQVRPEEAVDAGLPQGQPGGVEGGVPGGLVGAVVPSVPEATPPPARRPERAGISVKEPTRLKYVAPVYPDIAQQANVQGVVILECVISPAGRVEDVKVLRSLPLLDDAAVAAVKQWLYKPTLLEGVPVSVVMPVTVQFKLTDRR
jgi:protein TonB